MKTMSDTAYTACQQYLERLAVAEYRVQQAAHIRARRSKNTYRHNPSDYHRTLVYILGKGDETAFKALKGEQGYSSAIGF
jgi:hypothetical protein